MTKVQIIEELQSIHLNEIVKAKDKPSKDKQEIEQSDEFKHLQNKDQSIESNIN